MNIRRSVNHGLLLCAAFLTIASTGCGGGASASSPTPTPPVKTTPTIAWSTPAATTYGTALSATQLNATASTAGTFVYTPAAGTVLAVGTQTLSVQFTPADATNYNSASASVQIVVNKIATTITWPTPAPITYPTAISAAQQSATASTAGTFAYAQAIGTVLPAGTQTLSVTFTPTDPNYAVSTASVALVINKATPTISWAMPAAITYGTALSAAQQTATASTAGSFAYTQAIGTVLTAGTQTLSVTFTPTDPSYTSATASVSLVVNKATPTITWTSPAAITYGTPISAAQQTATSATAGSFTYMQALGTVLPAGTQTLSVTLTPTDTADYNTATATVSLVVNKATPTITWATPAAITYGTPISSTQLNATSSVAGTPVYTPASGTVLAVGTQTLSVTFTPTDIANYNSASTSVQIVVNKLAATITWPTPAPITYPTAISATQQNATASTAGTFAYAQAIGTVLPAGTQTLSVTFTPADPNYTAATATVQLVVNKANPTITWATPAAITYGTPISAAQQTATASTPGTFAYAQAVGTMLTAGTQTLSVTFTPTDTSYNIATATVQLVVNKATPTITWATPTAITYGTPISAAQQTATASIAGSFAYAQAVGTVLTAGAQTLSVTFTPTDTTNYNTGTATVSLVVNKATPTITWAKPAAIVYKTATSSAQQTATASVAGTFVYGTANGAFFNAGTQTLSTTFTPTDTTDYNTATATVSLVITKALPVITWATPASLAAGSTVPSSALNATAAFAGNSVAGAFVYTPSSGTKEAVPGALTLQTIFTPTDTANYLSISATNTLTVTPVSGTPAYAWNSVTILAGGFTDGLYFHPTQKDLLYAKMDIAGAYRFDKPNNRWIPLLDWINRGQGNYFHTDYAVASLALDPTDPKWLYLAVGIGSGTPASLGNLLISADQGATFTNVALPFDVRSNADGREGGERMVVDPNLPSRLYFGTSNDGLFSSDDRGLTWTQNTAFPALGTANAQGISFVLPVASSGTAGSPTPFLFAGVAEKTTAGTLNTLYVSTNAGASWTALTGQISGTLLPLRGRLGPNHELYVTYDDQIGPSGITVGMICAYTYTDAGAVGAPRNITPPVTAGTTAGFYDIQPDPSTPGALLTATVDSSYTINNLNQDYIYRSTDDGKTWVSFASDTHNITATPWEAASLRNHDGDWINLAVDPFDPKHVVYGTGSMIFATNDITVSNGAVAWYEQATGEEEHNVVALAAPPSGATILYSGLHDHNGMAHTNLTVSPQRYPAPNTNMASSIAYAEANPLIAARVGGDKDASSATAPYGAYTSDAGVTWTTFANTPLPASSTGDGAIAVSADGTTLVWAPYDVAPVYSTDKGATWTVSSGAPKPAKKVVADHVNTNTFYMSSMTYLSYPTTTTGGSLYISTDKGKTFAAVAGTSGLPAGDVYANFAVEGDVWLASPYGGLYRNTGTATAITMTKDSRFSNAYHLAFGAPKPGSGYAYTIYLDGAINSVDGLYRSTDGGTTWLLITDQQHQFGYLNAIEADRRTFGTVYLGTGGRGIIWGTAAN